MSTERTTPKYPTDGHPDGRSWEEYFRNRHDAIAEERDDAEGAGLGGEVTIIKPATQVERGLPRAISPWYNLCLANDWEVKAGHSAAHVADAYWMNGNVRKAAHDVERWWVNAVKMFGFERVRITISAAYVNGLADSTQAYRAVQGRIGLLTARQMEELIEHGPAGKVSDGEGEDADSGD